MAQKKKKEISKDEKKAARKAQPKEVEPVMKVEHEPVAKPNAETKPKGSLLKYLLIIIAIGIIVVAFFFYVLPSSVNGVSFPTFKSNFNSAHRVAIAITYHNASQYSAEVPCLTSLVQAIARTREANTIDLFIINQTTCTYPTNGLGSTTGVGITNSSSCISKADAEPAIFLNYSSSNRSVITQYHAFIYGDSEYMQTCPIAVEMS